MAQLALSNLAHMALFFLAQLALAQMVQTVPPQRNLDQLALAWLTLVLAQMALLCLNKLALARMALALAEMAFFTCTTWLWPDWLRPWPTWLSGDRNKVRHIRIQPKAGAVRGR